MIFAAEKGKNELKFKSETDSNIHYFLDQMISKKMMLSGKMVRTVAQGAVGHHPKAAQLWDLPEVMLQSKH